MPKTRLDWIIVTIIVAVLGSLWVGMTRVRAGEETLSDRPAAPQVGQLAPDFTLTSLDGEQITLSELEGKPVVLNFWATWCPPCRVEIPILEAVSQSFEGEAIILGIDVQESPGTVEAFVERFGMTYPVVLDQDGYVTKAYQVRAFPTTYFIDSRGVVTEVFTGPLNEPLLRTRLIELLGR